MLAGQERESGTGRVSETPLFRNLNSCSVVGSLQFFAGNRQISEYSIGISEPRLLRMSMQRLRSSGTSFMGSIAVPRLKKTAMNSWAAVHDTFFSTKDIFERHKVVFTVGTSIASVVTACIGYSLRHYHDVQVDRRLESIEEVMKNKYQLQHSELTKIVDSGSFSAPACFATAGTALIIGYGLGWRGGRWYANRQFRREQMKLLGQIKPKRWQLLTNLKSEGLNFRLRRSSGKDRVSESGSQTCDKLLKDAATTRTSGESHQS